MFGRFIITICAIGFLQNSFAQMDLSSSLFVDHRAKSVGDVVTILVIEYSSASSSAKSKSQKRTDHGYSVTGGKGIVDGG
jgi:flagellar basal body L-ring protein FlgH